MSGSLVSVTLHRSHLADETTPWNLFLVAFFCLLSSRPSQSTLPHINHCVKVAFQHVK